jgi:hypothetical protein
LPRGHGDHESEEAAQHADHDQRVADGARPGPNE